MKLGVPLLNIIIAILYVAISAFVTYWLKVSHHRLYKRKESTLPTTIL